MPRFVVNATGLPTHTVGADSWLEALGKALTALDHLDGMEALACEILPNQTVVARNVKTGQGYVVMRAEGEGTPAPAARRAESPGAFEVRNLAQSVFQANLGHALRSPLNAILGYSGMLLEDAHEHQLPHMAQDLSRVTRSARDLLALIDAGLEANRIASEEIRVQRLTFGIASLLHDAAAAFEIEAAQNRNRVEVRADASLGEMRADPTLLRTALLAMLDWSNNRVSEGVIRLDASVSSDSENTEWVRLWVADDGPSVSDQEAAELFQVMVGTGTGTLGAAATVRRGIARDLCRRQDGDLALMPGPEGRAVLGIRVQRGR